MILSTQGTRLHYCTLLEAHWFSFLVWKYSKPEKGSSWEASSLRLYFLLPYHRLILVDVGDGWEGLRAWIFACMCPVHGDTVCTVRTSGTTWDCKTFDRTRVAPVWQHIVVCVLRVRISFLPSVLSLSTSRGSQSRKWCVLYVLPQHTAIAVVDWRISTIKGLRVE